PLEQLPQIIRHQPLNNPRHDQQPTQPNEMTSKVSGLEHLAVVNGVDVFALDAGTITNKGDGGWKNWGFTGDYDYDQDGKEVTFNKQ
ncbi:hypothetical protein ACFVH3_40700, partial [Streptomyces sp. NPDC127118]